MAYTTPRTWVAGEIVTAANLNTHLRDNIAWIATDSPAAHAYSATTQSLTSGTMAAINLGTDLFDNCNAHSTVSATNRLTVPTGGDGKYLLAFQLMFTTAIAAGSAIASIQLNTTTAFTSSICQALSGTHTTVTSAWTLSAGDWVTGMGYHNAGGSKNVGNDGTFLYAPWFAFFWFRN